MIKRLLIVSLVVFMGLAGGQGRAADRIELNPDDVTGMWRNINTMLLVLSANIALDEEWVQGLRDLPPDASLAADAETLAREMAQFQERLNTLLASSDLAAMTATGDTAATPSALYIRSGAMLDRLVAYLIASDTLASVAIYYADADLQATTTKDLVAEVNLANQRISALMEESGI